jgi:hypothetical protein
MKPRLLETLGRIRANPAGRDFLLADAKDPDMAIGVRSAGKVYPAPAGEAVYRSVVDFHEQIRCLVRQGIVDLTAILRQGE